MPLRRLSRRLRSRKEDTTVLIGRIVFGIMQGTAIALNIPIILILIGVAMIITASGCKGNVAPILYYCLFVGAICLKITGVALIMLKRQGVDNSTSGAQ